MRNERGQVVKRAKGEAVAKAEEVSPCTCPPDSPFLWYQNRHKHSALAEPAWVTKISQKATDSLAKRRAAGTEDAFTLRGSLQNG